MSLDPRLHEDVRRFLTPSARPMLIDGEWVAAVSGRTIDVEDPAAASAIASVPDALPADVDRAVAAAASAFDRGVWSGLTAPERERRLLALADRLEARAEALAHLIVLENGKLLGAARREVEGSIRFVRYAAGWATKIAGDTLDVGFSEARRGFFAFTRREPVGVVAGIIPWNMPLSMAIWKVVPPLACGCTVVLKPSEVAPLSSLWLAGLTLDAGIPAGVVNVVTGGAETGAALAAHPKVNKITFTGSTTVGRSIGAAAMHHLTRVSLELGGKSPVIVFDDADLDDVPGDVARGIFYNQGQVCAAGSRLYVQRRAFERVVSGVADIAGRLRLGSGLDPRAELGPLVSHDQRQRVLEYVHSATAGGAEARTGGRGADRPGYFVEPTVLTGLRHDMPAVQEEIFGPVLVAMPFDERDEVIALANGTPYGLSASIYSRDLSRVHRLIPRLQAGTIYVNTPPRTDPNLPFGGMKQSGLGREHGASMIDLYTELKSVLIAYPT